MKGERIYVQENKHLKTRNAEVRNVCLRENSGLKLQADFFTFFQNYLFFPSFGGRREFYLFKSSFHFSWFVGHLGGSQWLFLVLCSGMTPGSAKEKSVESKDLNQGWWGARQISTLTPEPSL